VTPAERLLQALGVTEPSEIDLEAIAYDAGARIRYRPLEGCEACIVGNTKAAIISINQQSSARRKRFSIAHELGHWCHHRGHALVCRVDDFQPRNALAPERIADAYAADLLMPRYLFDPAISKHEKLTLKVVGALSEQFDTSFTATVIRAVEGSYFPAFAICHTSAGRKWFARSSMVPARWFPSADLDPDSLAFDVLHANKPDNVIPRKIGADAWFDQQGAGDFEIYEQTCRTGADEIVTLLLITDGDMLDEEDYRPYRR